MYRSLRIVSSSSPLAQSCYLSSVFYPPTTETQVVHSNHRLPFHILHSAFARPSQAIKESPLPMHPERALHSVTWGNRRAGTWQSTHTRVCSPSADGQQTKPAGCERSSDHTVIHTYMLCIPTQAQNNETKKGKQKNFASRTLPGEEGLVCGTRRGFGAVSAVIAIAVPCCCRCCCYY